MEVTSADAILSRGHWFTDGHVEIGGADSISAVPLGKKLFIIAERGEASIFLKRYSRSLESLASLLLHGPGSFGSKLRICWSTPDAFLVQPALCCHAVVTFSQGPTLVTGWEAAWKNDISRGRQLMNHFSIGMGFDRVEHLLSLPEQEAATTIEAVEENGAENDVVDNVTAVVKGKLSFAPRRNVQMKRRRLEKLPSVRRGFAKRKEKRAGQLFLLMTYTTNVHDASAC